MNNQFIVQRLGPEMDVLGRREEKSSCEILMVHACTNSSVSLVCCVADCSIVSVVPFCV